MHSIYFKKNEKIYTTISNYLRLSTEVRYVADHDGGLCVDGFDFEWRNEPINSFPSYLYILSL